MSQLIIDFSSAGRWSARYHYNGLKSYKTLTVPDHMRDRSIFGIETDNRDAWRKRLDKHTSTAEYEIIRVEPSKHL